MTNTEIAVLAHRAGFGEKTENSIRIEEFAKLKHFAEAVAAKEREACADIAENWNSNGMPRTGVANEIRARGEA